MCYSCSNSCCYCARRRRYCSRCSRLLLQLLVPCCSNSYCEYPDTDKLAKTPLSVAAASAARRAAVVCHCDLLQQQQRRGAHAFLLLFDFFAGVFFVVRFFEAFLPAFALSCFAWVLLMVFFTLGAAAAAGAADAARDVFLPTVVLPFVAATLEAFFPGDFLGAFRADFTLGRAGAILLLQLLLQLPLQLLA